MCKQAAVAAVPPALATAPPPCPRPQERDGAAFRAFIAQAWEG